MSNDINVDPVVTKMLEVVREIQVEDLVLTPEEAASVEACLANRNKPTVPAIRLLPPPPQAESHKCQ